MARREGEHSGGDKLVQAHLGLLIHSREECPRFDLRFDDHADPIHELRGSNASRERWVHFPAFFSLPAKSGGSPTRTIDAGHRAALLSIDDDKPLSEIDPARPVSRRRMAAHPRRRHRDLSFATARRFGPRRRSAAARAGPRLAIMGCCREQSSSPPLDPFDGFDLLPPPSTLRDLRGNRLRHDASRSRMTSLNRLHYRLPIIRDHPAPSRRIQRRGAAARRSTCYAASTSPSARKAHRRYRKLSVGMRQPRHDRDGRGLDPPA